MIQKVFINDEKTDMFAHSIKSVPSSFFQNKLMYLGNNLLIRIAIPLRSKETLI